MKGVEEEEEVEVEERMEIQGLYGGMGDDEFWEEEYNIYRAMPENPPKEKKMKMVQDAVVSQHHQRMIKNRESAARSRERKQAYNLELEGMIKILTDENEQLKRQEVEDTKKRLKQLMETLIPVEEMSRPPRRLRKTQSI
ncbi:ABSCISIC ACID-INSENSITIVE 5-like protein 6 [Cinnamomum micranthum f. kanehirae]|uniref:ABSCISIC ACID-INSENSITIVE 5-like protein 6 n=1 Tax=Cinnamomum micranthum f. kanehirae TaxID=337451 RepID=A0A443PAK7_9MAGN|nr:ABSCISIC ACID-INSENSITIVE 5-like protein 6 [Cinnamomum micranthum f. kanehirae]